MAKIDITNEILKYDDADVIEFLTGQMSGVIQLYAKYDNPADLVGCATTLGLVYNVLKEMNKRNKQKTGQDETVVL